MSVKRRLAGEAGFTLAEMIVALLVGTIVLLATFNIFDVGQRASASHQARADAVQRGRTALEQITQELRSQTCLGKNLPAIVHGDDNSITFYADMSPNTTFVPQLRKIQFMPDGRVIEYTWTGAWDTTSQTPKMIYPAQPSNTRVLLTGVQHDSLNRPYLRYWAFTGTAPATASIALNTPLSEGTGGDIGRVVQIGVSFALKPNAAANRLDPIDFQGGVYVRTADPMDPTHSPECM